MQLLTCRSGRIIAMAAALTLALSPCARVLAQAAPPDARPVDNKPPESRPPDSRYGPETTEVIPLRYATAQNAFNDVQTALRNMLPHARIYGILSQDAITIRANAEDMESAHKLIAELDKPRKSYRVTFTLRESNDSSAAPTRRIALLVVEGDKTTLRQGQRFPIATGATDATPANQTTQFQYVDVGLNLDAYIDGDHVRVKVEQTAIADEKSGVGAQDPIIRQTTLDGYCNLTSGKPLALGSIDVPGTTRHQDIEVTSELLP